MTFQEFLSGVGLVFGVMALVSLLELAVPLFARGARGQGRAAANLGLTALTLLLNWGLYSLAASLALLLSLPGRGLLASLALPLPALVAVSIVTLDLCTYFAHRTMHAIPALWRVHRVHHSDPFVDVTTTLRQHPVEGLWRFLWILVPTWALGLPASGVVLYRLALVVQAAFEHGNFRLWQPLDRALSRVWCTPNMHKVHHSRAPHQTDTNYGNLLSLFDRGLRTFTPTDAAFDVVYGLAEIEPERAKSLQSLMLAPLR